jgi:hypothetical protein
MMATDNAVEATKAVVPKAKKNRREELPSRLAYWL